MSQASLAAAGSGRTDAPGSSRLAADSSRPAEAVHTRDTLLTAVAHDLKNSLGTIRLRVDLLLEQLDDDSLAPRAEESLSFRGELARVLTTSAHMERMLDDLLGLARIQAGHRLDLIRESMDLIALTERVVAELLLGVDKPRIQIVASEPEMIGTWDPWQMERVLRNLLSNAVKYSPDGGEISVRVDREHRRSGEFVLVAVADHGMGIPESDLASVFDHFHRGSNVRGRIGGLGIGLSSARQIVRAHGGTLTVESEESLGSTFTVRVPLTGDASMDRARMEPGDGQTATAFGLLRESNLLSSIPAAALGRLAELSVVRAFGAGAHLMQEGRPSESLYLIVEGRVRAERSRGYGSDPIVLGNLGPGEVVGEMGALDGELRSATVTALEDTVTIKIPSSALVGILLRYHDVGALLLRTLSRRLRDSDARITPMGSH